MAGARDHGAIVAKRYGIVRSTHWPAVEREHLRGQPHCVACAVRQRRAGTSQVHHLYPFHVCIVLGRPDLELDPRNLMTLCERRAGAGEDHHLLLGHLDDFESFDPVVRLDAEHRFHGWTESRIRASEVWVERVDARPLHLRQMKRAARLALREKLDALFPPESR